MISSSYQPNMFHLAKVAYCQPGNLLQHSQNVAVLAADLAQSYGCNKLEKDQIFMGCLFHDIGKQFIPSEVINKKGRFTTEEFEDIKLHTWKGYNYLINLISDPVILQTVLYHHERWDGSGYPYGLASNEIPLCARICAVVDVWDALISDRCYRSAWDLTQAFELIWTGGGSLFDPDIAFLFLEMIEKKSSNGQLVKNVSLKIKPRHPEFLRNPGTYKGINPN
ncbi:MAG TPA: HD-GYP domain-containing protein [Anaerolineales bacterium]|nr:HD-GYP domain-containing protein [Anaerolineales bacterium]HNO92541.1 HD-GYP domain-containing protein [Anaerolineales bacterium]